MLYIGAPAARFQDNGFPVVRVIADGDRRGLAGRIGEEFHRPVVADGQDIVLLERHVGALVLDIGPEAADAGLDHFAGFRMGADIPRQRQQAERDVQVDGRRIHIPGQRCPFRLLFALGLAQLDIYAVRPAPHGDGQAGARIGAQFLGSGIERGGAIAAVVDDKGPCMPAIGVVGAADEGAIAPHLQAQLTFFAGWACPGIPSRAVVAEEMGPKKLVERIQHLANPQFGGGAHGVRELGPEVPEDRLPVDPPTRNVVQLVLQIGGKVILHVAREEALKERRDQPASVLGEEPAALEPHIIPILQDRDNRCIGRRAPDTEFLEALYQARFGEAGRRLREMLLRQDAGPIQSLAFLDVR